MTKENENGKEFVAVNTVPDSKTPTTPQYVNVKFLKDYNIGGKGYVAGDIDTIHIGIFNQAVLVKAVEKVG